MSDRRPGSGDDPARPAGLSDRREIMRGLALGGVWAGATGAASDLPRENADSLRYSIVDFGADPRAADNKAAIERGIQAALRTGRTLYVPPGTYTFSQIDFGKNDAVSPTRLLLCGEGTLRSVFRGTAFIASGGHFYDLVIDGLRFESQAGAGTALIDGGAFVRLIITPGTQISQYDWTLKTDQHLQSVRMIGCLIRGGNGAVVKARAAFDCVFTHNVIEFATDGIVIDGDGDPAAQTCRIENNLLEGLGGRAIVLGACLATTISSNYFEGNVAGDIRLDAGTAAHKGLRVQSNSIQLSKARLDAGEFGIVWGKSTALPVRAGGNYCNGGLHDTSKSSSIIDMSGDFAAGPLYSGYVAKSVAGRMPIGRAIYSDGIAWEIAWFDRHLTLDPYNNEVRFAGGRGSSLPTGVEHPVVTFGTAHPAANPGSFSRKHWAQGSVVFNAAAAQGTPSGWICHVAGTPGTWAVL